MPIKHAALKQLRKDPRRTVRNQAIHSELKTLKKQMRTLLGGSKSDDAKKFLPVIMRRFDQAAAKGIIHKNTASRVKSRLMAQLVKNPVTPLKPRQAPDASGVSPSASQSGQTGPVQHSP